MSKIILLGLLMSLKAVASEQSEYMDLARSRKYIGGPDESDLKVQAVLYQAPNKKKKPVKVEPNEGF